MTRILRSSAVRISNRTKSSRVAEPPVAVLSAAVTPDPDVQRGRKRIVLEGDIPSPMTPPSGCPFRTRCPLEPQSAPRSHEEEPLLRDVGNGHFVACHLVEPGGAAPLLVDPVEGAA